MNSKYNWNEIVKDSKKIIRDTTKNGNRKLISTMKELYDRLNSSMKRKEKRFLNMFFILRRFERNLTSIIIRKTSS